METGLLEWGLQFVLWVQSWGDGLRLLMNGFTFTGNIEFYLLLLPLLYWTVNRRLGVRLALFLLVSIVINNLIKMLLHNPRPYWLAAQVQVWTTPEVSFGLPSGHAQNAVVMWGLFAIYGRRLWGWLVAILLIILTGVSRVYLGVHFPTDVIVGWLLGIFVLWVGVQSERTITGWVAVFHPSQQLMMLFAISLVLTLAGLGVSSLVQATWSLPASWVTTALAASAVAPAPFSLHDVVTATGALWGLSAGALLCTLAGGFSPTAQTWRERLGRLLIGIAGVLLLWRGLDTLFALMATEDSTLGYLLRYLRYAAVGFWVALVAPMLFLRFGLAKPAPLPVPQPFR